MIELKGVGRQYPQQENWALRDVTLSIESGSFVALMGQSGCGKSTLLNLIGAIDTPSVGELWINGKLLSNLDDQTLTRLRAESMGYVFQFFNLLSTLTVRENIALPLELNKRPAAHIRQRVDELLELTGMGHRAAFYPSQLSGGEMQRVAIARSLANEPRLLLADEPTGNLDSENGQHILQLLQRLSKDAGCTLLMATHSTEAAAFAQRLITMKDGRVVSDVLQTPVASVC